MRMNYHHLYYFWRVAKSGNLTKTANELYVSQSSLSMQIKQLEQSISTPLFERVGRKLLLTEEGKKVLAYAEDIFSKGEELESLISRGLDKEISHLRIGVLNTLSRNFAEQFLSPLFNEPDIRLTLVSRSMSQLLGALQNHQLDLILTNQNISPHTSDSIDESTNTTWQVKLIGRQPLSIVGPSLSSAALKKMVFPESYIKYKWLLPGRQTEMRSAFESYCTSCQFQPDWFAEVDDMAMLRLLARDSGALAVLPPVVVKDEIKEKRLMIYHNLPNTFENFYAILAPRKFIPQKILKLIQSSFEV